MILWEQLKDFHKKSLKLFKSFDNKENVQRRY